MTTSDKSQSIKPARRSRATLASVSAPTTAKIISIVNRTRRCEQTIAYLRDMLAQAEAGDLHGIAVVAMLKDRKYAMHVTGEAYRNPTFTRGMLTVLDDELANQIAGR